MSVAAAWRSVSVADLLPRAQREACRLGVSRLSELTGLDVLGVPCWQATRPGAVPARGNVTVLNGKAWAADEARLGALMEAIERHWAEGPDLALVVARPSELAARALAYVRPDEVPLPLGLALPDDPILAWASGIQLGGPVTMVPAHDALCPFTPPPGAVNPAVWRSVGLAAGATVVDAVLHGLLEVIERDAVAVAEAARRGTSVDIGTATSPELSALCGRLADHDVDLEVKRLDGMAGVPVFAACLDDRGRRDPFGLVAGYAAHPDPYLALEGAVLEAVQTRASVVAGAREDLDRHHRLGREGYDAARRALSWWLEPTDTRLAAPQGPLPPPVSLPAVLDRLLSDLAAAGFTRVVAVPLSGTGAAVTVVRVVVPGASHVVGDTVRLGCRLAAPKRV